MRVTFRHLHLFGVLLTQQDKWNSQFAVQHNKYTWTENSGLLKKVLYGEAPSVSSNSCTNFLPKWYPLIYLEQDCVPFLYPMDKPIFAGFQSFWKGERVQAFMCQNLHPSIYFASATISFSLQRSLWPFHMLTWQLSLPFSILRAKNRHPLWAVPPRRAH